MENKKMNDKKNLMVSASILIAGALIAGAIIYSNQGKNSDDTAPVANNNVAQQQGSTDKVRPVSADDHVRGNPNAPVVIVEYSDFECPFCKNFDKTMNKVMDEYGKDGKVAWVYRHFPLEQLHSKARGEAIASECIAELGGEDAFWKFSDRWYELTPSNNQTPDTVLPQIVKELGIDKTAFDKCINSGKYDKKIDNDIANAVETGGQGTPWSIVIAPNGKTYPLSGAQPYSSVKQLIDIALSQK